MASLPPLLLLPGTLCTPAVFDAVLPPLQAVAPRVLAVSFREERSIDAMIDSALEQAGDDGPWAVAGFSMGGMVALAMALDLPARVERLALLNSNSHGDLPERFEARTRLVTAARSEGIGPLVEREMLPGYLHLQRAGDRRQIVQMASELGAECFEAQSQALATRKEQTPALRRIACPTLVLGAEHDLACPPQVQLSMQREIPGSDLVILGGCGHFTLLERPGSVARALVSWYLGEATGA